MMKVPTGLGIVNCDVRVRSLRHTNDLFTVRPLLFVALPKTILIVAT